MRHALRLASCALLAAASIGCSSSGGEDSPTEPTDDDYAVTATLIGSDLEAPVDFRSNDYFANYVGNFAFAFQAVDGEYTILISIQSVEGEPLPLRIHAVGSDEETRIVTGASLIIETDQGNAVYNAESGSGAIELTEFNALGASGSFAFEVSIGELSSMVVGGEFDLGY
jgi:hypothetical protein